MTEHEWKLTTFSCSIDDYDLFVCQHCSAVMSDFPEALAAKRPPWFSGKRNTIEVSFDCDVAKREIAMCDANPVRKMLYRILNR